MQVVKEGGRPKFLYDAGISSRTRPGEEDGWEVIVPREEMTLACCPTAIQASSSERGEPSDVRVPWKILMATLS